MTDPGAAAGRVECPGPAADDGPGGRVLDALGDPTRRRLLELLRGGERTVSDLTRRLPVSQSAVSQHLRVLRQAGLVSDRAESTRRYYRVRLDGLVPLRAYLDSFWDGVLDAFTSDAHTPTDNPDPGSSRSAR
jgi:DNA-binding transcriptional ArsR family regulator